MKIAVFGAGGVGGYFGGRLAQAGEDVVFVARGDHLRAMRAQGLRVDSIHGDFTVSPVHATDDPMSVGVVDCVLVAVKTWQVDDAARAMLPMIGERTFVVPLLNGVEAPDQLASHLGRERVLGGLCSLISMVAGPGHIRHTGAPPSIKFGELDDRVSERVTRLRKVFERAEGLTVEVPQDIHVAMWSKFLLIAPWSGVGAATRAPIGVTRRIAQTRALIEQSMREVSDVAAARGVNLPPSAIATAMDFIDRLPEGGTASMQRDIVEGRPSELDAQNGAVVRLGKAAGVDTPVNAILYASLLPQERKARGELSFD